MYSDINNPQYRDYTVFLNRTFPAGESVDVDIAAKLYSRPQESVLALLISGTVGDITVNGQVVGSQQAHPVTIAGATCNIDAPAAGAGGTLLLFAEKTMLKG